MDSITNRSWSISKLLISSVVILTDIFPLLLLGYFLKQITLKSGKFEVIQRRVTTFYIFVTSAGRNRIQIGLKSDLVENIRFFR